jgi:glycosyltransferase involved in cell wall biosynthesis
MRLNDNNIDFSIITPNFNRGELLYDLYNSIINNLEITLLNIEWIIVDDGSSDNTRLIVSSLISKNKFPIYYYFIDNSGKHVACNLGIKKAIGNFIFIIDNDDKFSLNAFQIFKLNFSRDITFFRKKTNTKSDLDVNLIEFDNPTSIYVKYKIELGILIKSSVAKSCLFPVFHNEKLLPELLWFNYCCDLTVDYKFVNQFVIDTFYRADGLSNNFSSNVLKSPNGFQMYYRDMYKRLNMSSLYKWYCLYALIKIQLTTLFNKSSHV